MTTKPPLIKSKMMMSYELFFTDYTWLSTNQSLYLGFLLQAATDE